MDGPVILRRLAVLRRSRITQAAPARNLNRGASADQALRSYKWSYIRLAALHLRWHSRLSFRPTRWQILFPSAPFSILIPAENNAFRPVRFIAGVQPSPSKLLKHPACIHRHSFDLLQLSASPQFDRLCHLGILLLATCHADYV